MVLRKIKGLFEIRKKTVVLWHIGDRPKTESLEPLDVLVEKYGRWFSTRLEQSLFKNNLITCTDDGLRAACECCTRSTDSEKEVIYEATISEDIEQSKVKQLLSRVTRRGLVQYLYIIQFVCDQCKEELKESGWNIHVLAKPKSKLGPTHDWQCRPRFPGQHFY